MADFDVGSMLHDTMLLILKLGGPPLAVALVVGLLLSLLQAVTQINESTIAFVAKVVAIGAVLLFTGGHMLNLLTDFTHMVFDHMVAVGG
jgi:flagellar biosynthetic protein FliQ